MTRRLGDQGLAVKTFWLYGAVTAKRDSLEEPKDRIRPNPVV